MVWEIDDLWKQHYEKAKEFYETKGNLDIPATYVTTDRVKLGNWYLYQLASYRDELLTDEKSKQIEAIGIPKESVIYRNWMNNYQACKEYYEANGNLNISKTSFTENGARLRTWISGQRESYKQGRLTKEQRSLLEAIGMEWNCFDEK